MPDNFWLAFGDVKGRAPGLSDQRDEVEHERKRLNQDAPHVVRLPSHDVGKPEGTHQEEEPHHRKSHGDFVGDHHGRGAQAAEQSVLGVGRPAAQHRPVNREPRKREDHQKPRVSVQNLSRNARKHPALLEGDGSKPGKQRRRHDGHRKGDHGRRDVVPLVHELGDDQLLGEELDAVGTVLDHAKEAQPAKKGKR